MSLSSKIALVTGASRGIGAAVAKRLATNGATVVVDYHVHADRAQEVVSAIKEAGGQAHAVCADVSTVLGIRRLFEEALTRFGRVDVLVNNTGEWTFTPLAEITEEEFDCLFSLNAKGTLFGMQEAARHMETGGRVINISTAATLVAPEQQAVYVGTNKGLLGCICSRAAFLQKGGAPQTTSSFALLLSSPTVSRPDAF